MFSFGLLATDPQAVTSACRGLMSCSSFSDPLSPGPDYDKRQKAEAKTANYTSLYLWRVIMSGVERQFIPSFNYSKHEDPSLR